MSIDAVDFRETVFLLDDQAVSAFKASLRGELILPGDNRYDHVRQLYNGMIDKRPALIAECVDAADVIASVNFARENKLLLAIRGGGHNGAGLGSCDGGLVIDLSLMKGVHVNKAAATIRVEGGCTWGDVDHAAFPFGLSVPTGFLSTTGVGGLTLGGGLGYLTRRYGLTIDNLLEVDVVLSDGRLVTANTEQNADLFWALRGGGGNFGVVTSFLFRGCPISTVYGGPMFWELDHARTVMRHWRDLIINGPEEINGWFGFHTVPPVNMFPVEHQLKKMAAITWCYTGDPQDGEKVFGSIRQWAPPAMDFTGPIPLPALQSLFDGLYPPGLQWYWNADFFTELSDEVIDLHIKNSTQLPTVHSTMHLYPINGAAHRIGKNDTAWSYRDANFAQVIVGVDPDPTNNEQMIQWSKSYWAELHPYSSGGAYINMMMNEGQDRVRTAYRDNYARLSEIKARYDPDNLFRVNQNIIPAK